jgi:hypothetical protein
VCIQFLKTLPRLHCLGMQFPSHESCKTEPYLLCSVCDNPAPGLAMSNQRSFKIGSFRFAAFVPKKIECKRFKIKILDRNKTFSVISKSFDQKLLFCSVSKIFFNYLNVLFCLWKTLAQFVTFWFRFDIIF